MQKMLIVDFGDILAYAERRLGFHWNQAHGLMHPHINVVGTVYKENYIDGIVHLEGEHTEAREIMVKFMEHHECEEMYIKPKGYN